jgi:hypothetical protein
MKLPWSPLSITAILVEIGAISSLKRPPCCAARGAALAFERIFVLCSREMP